MCLSSGRDKTVLLVRIDVTVPPLPSVTSNRALYALGLPKPGYDRRHAVTRRRRPAPESDDRPAISVRESRPGRSVFTESGNTDGWIASDETVEVTR